MSLKSFVIVFLILLNSTFIFSQTTLQGVGNWRTHFTYQTANSITESDETIYCSSPYSFFSIDKISGAFKVYSRKDGLSDFSISRIGYNKDLKLLLIGYDNGNIDFISNNQLTNLNAIVRKEMIGSKRINDIYFHNHLAFLSCDFGLIIIDCIKSEVRESIQSFQENGPQTQVKSACIANDTIFAATDRGVFKAKFDPAINLANFNNWNNTTTGPAFMPSKLKNIKGITTLNNKTFLAVDSTGIYVRLENKWILQYPSNDQINFIKGQKAEVTFGGPYYVRKIFENGRDTVITNDAASPQDVLADQNNNYWIADQSRGLLKKNFSTNAKPESYHPNGPSTFKSWDLYYAEDKIYSVSGGYNATGFTAGNFAGYDVIDDERWTYTSLLDAFPGGWSFDVVSIYLHPSTRDLFLASVAYGLLKVNQNNGEKIRYLYNNSPLTPTKDNLTFIQDIEPDRFGNVWILNSYLESGSDACLFQYKANGIWGSKKSMNNEDSRYLAQLLLDDNGTFWMRSMPETSKGLIVYDSIKGTRFLGTATGNGGLPSDKIYSMAKDKEGQIWVGTDKGVAIFYEPNRIFNRVDAKIPRYDGLPLLMDQTVTCIKVDGGNRKWIGTRNGLWLFNDDGTEPILHFTVENSPLPSNAIRDVEIHERTGEVFIATDWGVVSYWGNATVANETFGEIQIFPNPVKPGFQGTVSITGLAEDATVKITDIFGNLIYETKAEGGMAVWNAKNYKGGHAKSGLYLVFASDKEGQEKLISKFSVLE